MKISFCRFLLLLLVATVLSFGAAPSVRAEERSGDIQKEMTPEEFKAAGLDKLSPEQLQHLNSWLQGYREKTEKAVEAKATKEGRRKVELIVSRVVGPFYGLTGHSIITLEDGTKWKQANHNDNYKGPGLDHLGVAVIKSGLFGWKMRIQGTQEFYVTQVQ
jgi:hypothetical protein